MGNRLIPSENMIIMILLGGLRNMLTVCSNSQSERLDFGHGPIAAEIVESDVLGIENLPLEVHDFPHLSND